MNQKSSSLIAHSLWKHALPLAILAFSFILMHSCSYPVVVYSQNCAFMPDPANQAKGFYNGKMVNDTVIVAKLEVTDNRTRIVPDCDENCLYSVEYRVTFWDLLRNTFSFGKRQKVRLRYVCSKPTN